MGLFALKRQTKLQLVLISALTLAKLLSSRIATFLPTAIHLAYSRI
jgi:hypothetical protein